MTERTDLYRFLLGRVTHVPYFAADETTRSRFKLRVTIPGGPREASESTLVEREGVRAARARGVTASACLVELEANGGRGGVGTHFVATSLRVLEGTDEYPWTVGGRLAALRARFDEAVGANREDLEAEFRAARTRRQVDPGGKILRELPQSEIVIYRPAWRSHARLLEVFFAYKRQAGFWIKSRRPAGNRPVKHAPPPEERGVSYAACIGARYVVDAAGRLAAEEVFPPSTFLEVPWQQRVAAGADEDPPGGARTGEGRTVAVSLRADRAFLRAGEIAALTIVATNRGVTPVWTNPSIICTGSWDIAYRDARGRRLRVDDRDAMGCPSGGILTTPIAPGASVELPVSWDGRLRPRVGESNPAPAGRYEVEASVRWADRGATPNAKGPHTFAGSAKTSIAVQ